VCIYVIRHLPIRRLPRDIAQTFAQNDICPEDISPEDICPERHLPIRHLPRKTFAHKTFAQKDNCPERQLPRKTFCPEAISTEGRLPRKLFSQKDICPQGLQMYLTRPSATASLSGRWQRCSSLGLWRLWGRLDCRCRPLPGLGSDSEIKTAESKGVPASCCLGPRRTWNTAYESLCKFVSRESFQRKNAIKKKGYGITFFYRRGAAPSKF
jgi:hypothetical protein